MDASYLSSWPLTTDCHHRLQVIDLKVRVWLQGEVTIRFENGAAVLSLGPTTAVDTSKTCSEV
jgi:hypothetical protein